MSSGFTRSLNNLNFMNVSLESIAYRGDEMITPPIILIKEIMSDLEKRNRTEEHLKRMRMEEFQRSRNVQIPSTPWGNSSMFLSTAVMNWGQ